MRNLAVLTGHRSDLIADRNSQLGTTLRLLGMQGCAGAADWATPATKSVASVRRDWQGGCDWRT